jgi:hypothetical protein
MQCFTRREEKAAKSTEKIQNSLCTIVRVLTDPKHTFTKEKLEKVDVFCNYKMEDIVQFRRFDSPDLHFLSSSSGHGDFGQFSSSKTKTPKTPRVTNEKLTWIHLRYYPPGLILESKNEGNGKTTEKMIDLMDFTQFSNLETTAQDLMKGESLFTLNNKPTLIQCLEKLKFRCKPDYRKRFGLRHSIKTHCLPVLGACVSRSGSKYAEFFKCFTFSGESTQYPILLICMYLSDVLLEVLTKPAKSGTVHLERR